MVLFIPPVLSSFSPSHYPSLHTITSTVRLLQGRLSQITCTQKCLRQRYLTMWLVFITTAKKIQPRSLENLDFSKKKVFVTLENPQL